MVALAIQLFILGVLLYFLGPWVVSVFRDIAVQVAEAVRDVRQAGK